MDSQRIEASTATAAELPGAPLLGRTLGVQAENGEDGEHDRCRKGHRGVADCVRRQECRCGCKGRGASSGTERDKAIWDEGHCSIPCLIPEPRMFHVKPKNATLLFY